jgi:hypothetical protein
MRLRMNWDGLGVITSVVCAIHCALLPLILPVLPLFGVNIIHNNAFEWGMIAVAFVIGAYSLYHGFIKHHRSFKPVLLFVIGFVFLVIKQLYVTEILKVHETGNPVETALLVVAVIFVIAGHLLNYRYCTKNQCHSPHHKH